MSWLKGAYNYFTGGGPSEDASTVSRGASSDVDALLAAHLAAASDSDEEDLSDAHKLRASSSSSSPAQLAAASNEGGALWHRASGLWHRASSSKWGADACADICENNALFAAHSDEESASPYEARSDDEEGEVEGDALSQLDGSINPFLYASFELDDDATCGDGTSSADAHRGGGAAHALPSSSSSGAAANLSAAADHAAREAVALLAAQKEPGMRPAYCLISGAASGSTDSGSLLLCDAAASHAASPPAPPLPAPPDRRVSGG